MGCSSWITGVPYGSRCIPYSDSWVRFQIWLQYNKILQISGAVYMGLDWKTHWHGCCPPTLLTGRYIQVRECLKKRSCFHHDSQVSNFFYPFFQLFLSIFPTFSAFLPSILSTSPASWWLRSWAKVDRSTLILPSSMARGVARAIKTLHAGHWCEFVMHVYDCICAYLVSGWPSPLKNIN